MKCQLSCFPLTSLANHKEQTKDAFRAGAPGPPPVSAGDGRLCPGSSLVDTPGPALSPEFQPPAARGQLRISAQVGRGCRASARTPITAHPHSPARAPARLPPSFFHFPRGTSTTFIVSSSQYVQDATTSRHTCGRRPGPRLHRRPPGSPRAPCLCRCALAGFSRSSRPQGACEICSPATHLLCLKPPPWACLVLLGVEAGSFRRPPAALPSAPDPFLPSLHLDLARWPWKAVPETRLCSASAVRSARRFPLMRATRSPAFFRASFRSRVLLEAPPDLPV